MTTEITTAATITTGATLGMGMEELVMRITRLDTGTTRITGIIITITGATTIRTVTTAWEI
jgi:hypothetical protein